jgi:hypothetical protein
MSCLLCHVETGWDSLSLSLNVHLRCTEETHPLLTLHTHLSLMLPYYIMGCQAHKCTLIVSNSDHFKVPWTFELCLFAHACALYNLKESMWENNEALDSRFQILRSFLLSFSLLLIFRVARGSRWTRYGSVVRVGVREFVRRLCYEGPRRPYKPHAWYVYVCMQDSCGGSRTQACSSEELTNKHCDCAVLKGAPAAIAELYRVIALTKPQRLSCESLTTLV